MKKSEWSDKQLEELLREMPKIEDHRDPRDIYQNVASKLKKRQQRTWVVPSIATVAAAALFLILSPNLMNWEQSTDRSVESLDQSNSAVEMKMVQNNEAKDSNIESIEEEELKDDAQGVSIQKDDTESNKRVLTVEEMRKTAVYEQDAEGNEVFTYAIPDQNAQLVVPVSVVVPKVEGKTKFTTFEEWMAKLSEQEWGLTDYYPLNASLQYDDESKVLNIDVPKDHQYGIGSAEQTSFLKILNDTLYMMNIEKVSLTTEGSPGIMFDNYGMKEEITVQPTSNHAYYFFYPNTEEEKPYLVPTNETFNSVEEALQKMKEPMEELGLTPSIPSDINFEVIPSKSKDLLVIQLDSNSKLTDDSSTLYMIEAILLTAKDFNYQKVKIENSNLAQIGDFIFNEEWKVPVAPNKQTVTE
ncbi:GerMN domain-containing protein (plasmid) [Bacillus sp. 31A1R]|uniref:GerMN domain-containing protein n=1 Tax=Robertmurraya mangrovi TaxID=3098077 RepID=A0ABU5IVK6_9BACI|nr:GerMN domain-containing protein [Bacillus sp. 31A1R]MDZ5471160.1 GerMN domain-containing protein [Bacillus sp. 31A1R]